MGAKQSIYEKIAVQDYYKLSSEEHGLIRRMWTEIENKPQYYGNLFFTSFLESYPQYIKFYTLNPYAPLTVDVRITAKFTVIMEAMGYLMLDVYRNPKQLDRLVGYIAMVHKDMRLDKEDMTNFGESFLKYLDNTFPSHMVGKCREAMTKYFNSIVNGIGEKLDQFRKYEMSVVDTTSTSRCTICVDNLVFGQTMIYWNERKQDWNMLLNKWAENSLVAKHSITNEEEEEEEEEETDIEERLRQFTKEENALREKELSKPNIPALNHSARHSSKEIRKVKLSSQIEYELSFKDKEIKVKTQERPSNPWTSAKWKPTYIEKVTPRERFRARSIAREAATMQPDARILRKRLRSSRIVTKPSINRSNWTAVLEIEQVGEPPRRYTNTARERRRETSRHFSFTTK